MYLFENRDYRELHDNLYFNQFVLGPHGVLQDRGWQQVSINAALTLSAHPELQVARATTQDCSLTLVGEAFDAEQPNASNADILARLIRHAANLNDLFAATESLGGRWLIIVERGTGTFLFHDALGLRQVFFTHADSGLAGGWAMSQPGIVAQTLGLKVSDEATRFIDSFEFRKNAEYRWPAASSAFSEISRLLPNHYLDLKTGQAHRYWPHKVIAPQSMEVASNEIGRLLRGLMAGMTERCPCVLGLTAGLDSRVVLASAKPIIDRMSATTVRQGRMPSHHDDLVIGAQLAKTFQLPHQVVNSYSFITANFSSAFKKNVFLSHEHYGPDAEAIFNAFGRKKFTITGSASEVGRLPFRRRPEAKKSTLTAHDLASLQHMGDNPFALQHFSSWLDDIAERHGVPVLDLFGWEQGHGGWLASTQLEFDIAWKDIFTPFNCRKVLLNFLSVEERLRGYPGNRMHKHLISTMWPELLKVAINPSGQQQNTLLAIAKREIKRGIKSILKCK